MPHGGVLTIATRNAQFDHEHEVMDAELPDGDYVVLEVSDTGIGMPLQVLSRAVEPFFTTKGPGEGSGLGLSMIYGFARQSGGHLALSSEVGHGTSVRLYLPRAVGQPLGSAEPAAVPPVSMGDEAILVVDDSPEMRHVAARHLTSLGYHVLQAEHGMAALEILRSGDRIDLLFTDVVMPDGLTGFQLAEAARSLRPGLRVLFTTGYAGGRMPDTEHDGEPVRMIRKPYRRAELAEQVRAAFGR